MPHYTGGCLCGAVRVAISGGPNRVYLSLPGLPQAPVSDLPQLRGFPRGRGDGYWRDTHVQDAKFLSDLRLASV